MIEFSKLQIKSGEFQVKLPDAPFSLSLLLLDVWSSGVLDLGF